MPAVKAELGHGHGRTYVLTKDAKGHTRFHGAFKSEAEAKKRLREVKKKEHLR